MLKHATAVLVLACAVSAPANAEYLYQGFLKFTTKNAACTKGPKPGTILKTQFHPKTVSGATQFWEGSAFTITNYFDARAYRLELQDFSATAQTVINTVMAATTLKTVKPAKIQVTSMTPPTIATTTTTVTIVGKITNPLGLAGQETCLAGFIWSGNQRN